MAEAIDFERIKKALPHRYPFLLIDRVLEHGPQSIRALKNVTANEPFFNGHFPEMAVMPGVLQIEAMAQAAGLILALSEAFDPSKEIAFLAGVDNAKFKRVVVPGDQLIIDVKVIAKRTMLLKVEAHISVDGKTVSSAEIMVMSKSL